MWYLALGCVAFFFLFSLVVQALFNNIIVGYFGVLKSLSYLQAAGLWFLVTLLIGWIPLIGAWARKPSGRLPECIRTNLKRWVERAEPSPEE
jgi:cytochrome bd-type quinol oxidase subunit 1